MKNNIIQELSAFINFSLERFVFNSALINDTDIISDAFEKTLADFCYHLPGMQAETLKNDILHNSGRLPVFLYRLMKELDLQGFNDQAKYQVHFLMKLFCGCEIYWSADIDEGFKIEHGLGTVIGSNCKIGKGFRIYQGCTVGQKDFNSKDKVPIIGNDVTLFANSQILGAVTIGDKTVIGAHSLVISSFPGRQTLAGIPAKAMIKKGRN